MEIKVNGKRAAIKKGTSFEYVAENRQFSGSDGYTLSIVFPLRGCATNIAIFGNVGRADAAAGKAVFDCEIRSGSFVRYGSLVITEITRSEVKTQFLEGRSEQNFDTTFDSIYINELDLGSGAPFSNLAPTDAWHPWSTSMKCVALPWVNEASGNVQNRCIYSVDEGYAWHPDATVRSWQPYLLHITRAIIESVGYSADLTEWENHTWMRHLLVCNTLPGAWNTPGFARALPRWSVKEYLEKLELFLGGEFTVDHRGQSVRFALTDAALSEVKPVELHQVTEEYCSEVSVRDARCDYAPMKNLVYKECDHSMWRYYSCDWLFKALPNVRTFPTLSGFLQDYGGMRTWDGRTNRGNLKNSIIYVEDVDTHFVVRSLYKVLRRTCPGNIPNEYTYTMELRPVNLFGGRILDQSEEADKLEIEFVPACVDYTEEAYGRLLFLSFSGFGEEECGVSGGAMASLADKQEADATLYQPLPARLLAEGEKESRKNAYYDRIYIGWWDGTMPPAGKLPHPHVEEVEVADDWSGFKLYPFSMRLNRRIPAADRTIVPEMKRTFRFIGSDIPDPRAVFHIRGKRYLCEKITATFTESSGMSRLLKGEFYPIRD